MISINLQPQHQRKQQGPSRSRSPRQAVHQAPASRVVPKPIPASQTRDARTYQITQLRRRFHPKETEVDSGAATLIVFSLKPSDPDFPFELESLQCELRVPKSYPKAASAMPVLRVLNPDIPKGFAVNIENGWTKLVEDREGVTLLSLLNALDHGLEGILSEKKADTVKMTIFKDTRHLQGSEAVKASTPPVQSTLTTLKPEARPYIPEESYSREQISQARARRAQEVQQLEARMGRMPFYQRSCDGVVYNLPIEPKCRAELPTGLQTVRSLQLIVPLLYPLQTLRILLNEVESADAEPLEEVFASNAAAKKDMALMTHINYLTQNAHVLAKKALAAREVEEQETRRAQKAAESAEAKVDTVATSKAAFVDEGKSHIRYVQRPPDWTVVDNSGEDSTDEDDEDDGGAVLVSMPDASSESQHQPMPLQQAELGTAISFPHIELYGIELLELNLVNISVKCDRCKTVNEIGNLKQNTELTSESCRKCATPFTIRYRPELVHANSVRAGFFDLAGCTIADLLPSVFNPTCSKCSTAMPKGVVAVRGDITSNVCRECHARFTFKITQVKFLAYAPGAHILPPTSGPKRRLEKLGLQAGEPLPERGTCTHYKKSYRWFRFSCCNKVYACDKCHDDMESHLNEWANRMICGFCSREQSYAVESCGFCGRSVIGKRGRGFWEGGKGTRDQVKMSRKDPRKYKRIGHGTAAT